jgi:hypothetical protein
LYAQISKRKYAKVVKAKPEAVTTIRLERSIMVALDKAAKGRRPFQVLAHSNNSCRRAQGARLPEMKTLLRGMPSFQIQLSIQADLMTRGMGFGAPSWRNSSSRVSA